MNSPIAEYFSSYSSLYLHLEKNSKEIPIDNVVDGKKYDFLNFYVLFYLLIFRLVLQKRVKRKYQIVFKTLLKKFTKDYLYVIQNFIF